jgi:hypothetical protein
MDKKKVLATLMLSCLPAFYQALEAGSPQISQSAQATAVCSSGNPSYAYAVGMSGSALYAYSGTVF